jgi:hypothetical protein
MKFILNCIKNVRFLGAFSLILMIFFVTPSALIAQVPFGSTVVSVVPCVNGLWITMGGTGIPGLYMYLYGASVSPFLSGPLSHPGQSAVGYASAPAPCLVPCFVGLCPIGFGLTILPFHGTSL